MKYRFYNAKILTNGQIIEGEVQVTDNIITYVGKTITSSSKKFFDRTIDVEGNLLLPGLVNAHAHCGLAYGRGLSDDTSLEDWLYDNIFPMESKMNNEEEYYYATLHSIREFVRGGITSCADMYFYPNVMYRAYNESGFRANIAVSPKDFETLPNNAEPTQTINYSVCFHSVYTTSEDDIADCIKASKKYGIPTSAHLCETLTEVGNSITKNNATPIAYLDEFGFFDTRCIAAHCVHLDDNDIEILKNKNVSVVTNPSSNLKLGSGIAPLLSLQKKGINICIGTDSSASNNHLDMFKEMFLASTLQKGILHDPKIMDNYSVLQMATVNGAKALGYDNLGEIKENYLADLILVNIKEPNYMPYNHLEKNLIYCANSKDVYLTMVNGKILYENGEYNIGVESKVITEKLLEFNKKLNG